MKPGCVVEVEAGIYAGLQVFHCFIAFKVDALKTMNDRTAEVWVASSEMAEGNRLILDEVHNLQNFTYEMKNSMSQMTEGAEEMKQIGSILSDISTQVR